MLRPVGGLNPAAVRYVRSKFHRPIPFYLPSIAMARDIQKTLTSEHKVLRDRVNPMEGTTDRAGN